MATLRWWISVKTILFLQSLGWYKIRYFVKIHLRWKNIKCNLWIALTPAHKQRFLTDSGYIDYYSLFETPFGHLPYPLGWKRNQRKVCPELVLSYKPVSEMKLVNRWEVLNYHCSRCGEPTRFKNALCSTCRADAF